MADAVLYVAIGGASLTVGAVGTILTVRRGMISKDKCEECGKAKDGALDTAKGELKEDIGLLRTDLKEAQKKNSDDMKGVHTRLDTTNKELSELVGFLKARRQADHG